MELESQRPLRPDREEVGQAPLRHQARQPGQQAQVHGHHGRLGARRAPAAPPSLAELGYNVKCFCYQDTPRRAHSIAAQGGINAAKNYRNDGDSVYRLFYDTVKGGDFRAREANVYRLAEVSVNIIDQCVAQGVPFAREYGGLLDNRSFGGAQVSRTFYARGQTGPAAAARAPTRRSSGRSASARSRCTRATRCSSSSSWTAGRAASSCATWSRARSRRTSATRWCLATGGYGNVFYLSTNAKGCNATAIWRAYKKGAAFANPCFTQIHPTCIPVTGEYQSKLTLMSESLRNDGRVWVPKAKGDKRRAEPDPRGASATTTSSACTRASATSRRATSPRAPRSSVCDEGRGVGPAGTASTSTSRTRSRGWAGQDRGEVRQPLRDVRAHHRREPLQGADAHLPRRPLHDGRAVGGLQPDEHDPGPVRRSARRTSRTTGRTASGPRR